MSVFSIALPFFNLRFGNAILSKRPFQDVQAIELPPVKKWEPYLAGKKNAIEATILHDGKPIRFIAIHIETRSQAVRLQSAEVLLQRIQNSDTPYILLGDFNSRKSVSGTTVVDRLLEISGFSTDVNFATWKTFPSQLPDRGIDWILVNPALETANTKTISLDLSDHLMVTSEISFAN